MIEVNKSGDSEHNYTYMLSAVRSLLDSETDLIACLSNISAIINVYMERLNWAGFYLLKNGELVLGPFQGQPACLRIKPGKGVCGTAAAEGKILIVPNVHLFDGHIACDSNSNSEIVLPLFTNGSLFGVLDLDSPDFNRFTVLEEKYLKEIVSMIGEHLDAGQLT